MNAIGNPMKNDTWLDSQQHTGPGADGLDADLTPAALLQACVMLVDDDPLMTEVVQGHLEDAGYRNFVVTNDPRETLALMREHEPSILLLDLMMPQMSGYDVLLQVRAEPAFRYTPVIVLTAATGSDAKLKALQLGATDILSKPVDESELTLRVRNTLAFRRYHEHAVNVDEVTGLPSRRRFEQRLAEAAAQGSDLATFIVNVPVQTQVRETMGQPAADQLVRVIAARLEDAVRERATKPGTTGAVVARMRGEEFALLLPGMAQAEEAASFAAALGRRLGDPVAVQGQHIVPTSLIGISLSSADGCSREAMLKGAEQARSRAREAGLPYVFFSSELDRRSNERLSQATALREAVAQGQLMLMYQPKVDMHSGEVDGVEAQVHWRHPGGALLPPERFMALAEELDLGAAIGDWALRQACADASAWIAAGTDPGHVAVNIAAGHWQRGELLVALRHALRASGLPASRLAIEITEDMLHRDPDGAMRQLDHIATLGVAIVIDEFGSGHTSLSMVKRLPARELKVARAIVDALPGDKADIAIARTIVTLGHSLGLKVAADGVSSPEQLLQLTSLEYDQFQGTLFSQPVAAGDIAALLKSSR
jgi:diguanylate cyclase